MSETGTTRAVLNEIIEEMQQRQPLTADVACRLLERLDVEVMAKGVPAELGYSLLYELAECLALHLQERGALAEGVTCN